MKSCPNCSNVVEDSAVFCTKCGARFAVSQDPQQQYNNYGGNQPKKKNKGAIVAIVVAVLVVLGIIGSVAEKTFQEQGYGDGGNASTPSYNFDLDDSSSETGDIFGTDSTVSVAKSYTKGSIAAGWYINEWANMKFEVTSNWTENSMSEYTSYEDANTECGAILTDSNSGKQLVICFEKLNGASVSVSESAYLDIVAGGAKQQYADANYNCTVSSYYDTTIANEKFKTAKITFDGSTMVQQFSVRKYDGYMIFIAVTAQSSLDASAIVNNIRTIY